MKYPAVLHPCVLPPGFPVFPPPFRPVFQRPCHPDWHAPQRKPPFIPQESVPNGGVEGDYHPDLARSASKTSVHSAGKRAKLRGEGDYHPDWHAPQRKPPFIPRGSVPNWNFRGNGTSIRHAAAHRPPKDRLFFSRG